jgi:hypothetical protein
MNQKLQSFPAWTADSIDARQVMLIDLAKEIWKINEIQVEQSSTDLKRR